MKYLEEIRRMLDEKMGIDQSDDYKTLRRRRGHDTPTGVLEGKEKSVLLEQWYDFHDNFQYKTFEQFYSKREFCTEMTSDDFEGNELLFLQLLADRRFLFVEFNQSLDEPEYPSLSKIFYRPGEYYSKDSCTWNEAAEVVLKQGFVPTDAHKRAHSELEANLQEMQEVLARRRRYKEKGVPDFTLHLEIRSIPEIEADRESELSTLFIQFVHATHEQAYLKDIHTEQLQDNILPAIRCILMYFHDNPEETIYKPIVFFQLFTQEMTKLAMGKLKSYTFKPPRRTAIKPPEETPPNARAKIEVNIMLFDYLLKLFMPEKTHDKEEISYAKYLFQYYTKYTGFTHYDVSKEGSTRSFQCLPIPMDGVDDLGTIIRHHIFYCIPNFVSQLTPGLPNDRTKNSEALSLLLLRDAAYMPVETRLTDKVRRCLDDPDKGPSIISKYQKICSDDKVTRDALNKWCSEYHLEFVGEDIFSDIMSKYERDQLESLCNRFVLEYGIKEHILSGVRKNLSAIAQAFWGDLCLEGEFFTITRK